MIARTWTGTVRRADAAQYAEYIDGTSRVAHYQVVGALQTKGVAG